MVTLCMEPSKGQKKAPLRLRWRATFIDVDSLCEDEETAPFGSFRGSRHRATSVPVSSQRVGDLGREQAEVFGGERQYVADLGHRVELFADAVGKRMLDVESTTADTLSWVGTPSLSLDDISLRDLDDVASTFSALATPGRRDDNAAVGEKDICNPGSAGHPELCMRPCIYFATGSCANGRTCEYCHFGHTKRPVHLDKHHRELLHKLGFVDTCSLILPVVRSKVEAVEVAAASEHLLQQLYTCCGVSTDLLESPATNRHQRVLVQTLQAMTLRSILTTFGRLVIEEAPAAEVFCEQLLQHVRRAST